MRGLRIRLGTAVGGKLRAWCEFHGRSFSDKFKELVERNCRQVDSGAITPESFSASIDLPDSDSSEETAVPGLIPRDYETPDYLKKVIWSNRGSLTVTAEELARSIARLDRQIQAELAILSSKPYIVE